MDCDSDSDCDFGFSCSGVFNEDFNSGYSGGLAAFGFDIDCDSDCVASDPKSDASPPSSLTHFQYSSSSRC